VPISPSEPQVVAPDADVVEFLIPGKPDQYEVTRLTWQAMVDAGFGFRNPRSGYTEPDWEALKAAVLEVMSDRVVTTGTIEDLARNGITQEELYAEVFGDDALGLSGEKLTPEQEKAFDDLKRKAWGYCNLGTTGHVNKQAGLSGLVMVEAMISRDKINPETKRKVVGKELGRFLTANTKLLMLQTEDIVTRELEKAFTKVENYAKMVGERQPELAGPLARQGQAIARAAAAKFVHGDPKAVAALTAGVSTNGQEIGDGGETA
jgi:hypothetical protein